ncbi:hypothetical protein [Burkholderia cenocepacia]|uniref:hypothetical protein n=1 Tax=Burkholderia cenocepacia TaxID=95486 RepID=UPI0007620888|nr:hypothetical protein [Burkholderia cenocepacia]KWU26396.1 hypothetical protein AS149_25750 [Burkholderia cenocepacia]
MATPSQLLLDRLSGARERIKSLQVNFAFGEMLMALNDAAAAGVTLDKQHHAVVAEIQQLASSSWARTLGLDIHAFDRYRRSEPLLAVDGYVSRAEYVLADMPYTTEKLADVYDDDELLREALTTLFPDFEYPSFSHLSIDQVREKYAQTKRSA